MGDSVAAEKTTQAGWRYESVMVTDDNSEGIVRNNYQHDGWDTSSTYMGNGDILP